ncbi:MAG: CDP-diacylglycerol--glycerol-3-phosphate 3-phosphatidyltransferase [Thermodesulfobacteriota bacterium]
MSKEKHINIWNLPNILSLLRIATVPIFVLLLFKSSKSVSIIAASLFIVVSFTDLIDGYLARKRGMVTNLGKFLDPLADKLLIIAVLIMLVPMGRVPAWIVVLIACREIAVTGLRAVAADTCIIIAASKAGKYKTAFQTAAVIALLFHYRLFNINIHQIGMVLLWMALALTLWSGFEYFLIFFRRSRTTNGGRLI